MNKNRNNTTEITNEKLTKLPVFTSYPTTEFDSLARSISPGSSNELRLRRWERVKVGGDKAAGIFPIFPVTDLFLIQMREPLGDKGEKIGDKFGWVQRCSNSLQIKLWCSNHSHNLVHLIQLSEYLKE